MPASTAAKFNQFVEDKANGVHNLGADSLVVALTNVAPVAGNSVLADLTEIAYTNCSARALTTSSSSQTAGLYKLVLADLTLTASGGAIAGFRYVVIYNDTPTSPADPLIVWLDYGSTLNIADGESLLIDMSAVNGILQDQ